MRDSLESNPLSLRLLSSVISTNMPNSFENCTSDLMGERLMSAFVLLLSIRSSNNPCVQCLSCLDSALSLDGIGQIVEANLRSHIETCLKSFDQLAQESVRTKSTQSQKILDYLAILSKTPIFFDSGPLRGICSRRTRLDKDKRFFCI